MINFISNWAETIIIALIFIIIIEMLLPESSNKKYVKMVSGIYLIFTILNPILQIFNKEIDFDFFDKLDENVEVSSNLDSSQLENYYLNSINSSIKADLNQNGFDIDSVWVTLNSDNSEITKIIIQGKNLNQEEIIKYIVNSYGIQSDCISFK